MRFDPRPYQEAAIERVKAAYRAGKRAPCLVLPTGGGKTYLGSRFALGAAGKGARAVWWLAHRDELVGQAADRLRAEGAERVGIIAAGYPSTNATIQVASIQTLAARAAKGLPSDLDMVVFDECHHLPAAGWIEIVRALQPRMLLGLTATPERGDGIGLGVGGGGLFDELIQVTTVRELQAQGVLVPCVTYAPASYSKNLAQNPVAAHMARAPGERTVVFCSGVSHAEKVALEFIGAGIPAATVHGDTPPELRAARLRAFQMQDPQPLLEAGYRDPPPLVLCTPYVLTEGWDCPEASCCILARGCGHAGMMLQMVGRVLRSAPGKDRAVFVDLKGITTLRDRHGRLKIGLPEADRIWSLEGKAARLSERDEDEQRELKPCPACEAMIAAWAVDRDGWRCCPACRQRVLAPVPVSVEPRTLHAAGTAAPPALKAHFLATLARSAGRRAGKRVGWVAHRYRDRFGEWPPYGAAERALREAGIELVGPPPVQRVEHEPANEYEAAVIDALNCG